ncbi:MAG TPA: late competence development ComFB family protein [Trichocoleus sp.]|jgi:hypothetical protein
MGTYKNVMELLVEEEVVRQCKVLPSRVATYINPEELVAYALNQLPALYATSNQGLEYQIQKGRVKHRPEIEKAVQRAIAAVRRDPLRRYTPLNLAQATPLREVLQQIRRLLKNDQIEWEAVPSAVEQALKRVAYQSAQGGSTWRSSPIASEPSNRSTRTARIAASAHPVPPPPPKSLPVAVPQSDALRQDNYTELYDWDDPLYYSR